MADENGIKGITIHDVICAVNPDLYYKTSEDRGEAKKELKAYKELVKEKGIQAAAKKAKPQAIRYLFADKIFKLSPSDGLEEKHDLIYDSSSETLEPIYFYFLDLMDSMGLAPEKLIDNFTSSPGSGHFGDLGQRATIMQQQASRVLGDINNVTRSVLNLVYDLKDFKIRLQTYDDLKSSKPETREAALLSLKQIWMDKVDINKGNSSMKAMAFSSGGQVGMQTLVDAFLFVKDESLKGPGGNVVDINDRVKRVLKQRIHEFNLWLEASEKELRKRYEMERKYLKSQVNSIKLYSRWAKPYMRAVQQLEMKDRSKNPNLIKSFNSILLELTLFGKSAVNPQAAVFAGDLPLDFKKIKPRRDYSSCIVMDFNFRGIPQKTSAYQQHYVFGGKATVTLSAYALNENEIALVKKELEKADVGEALSLIEGATTGSLEEMQAEIDEFLREEDAAEKREEARTQKDASNPILALLGFYNPSKKSSKSAGSVKSAPEEQEIDPDNFIEKN